MQLKLARRNNRDLWSAADPIFAGHLPICIGFLARDATSELGRLPSLAHDLFAEVFLGHFARGEQEVRKLASHQTSLMRARAVPEPAAQIAARELALDRIRSAAQRARDLPSDVVAALVGVA